MRERIAVYAFSLVVAVAALAAAGWAVISGQIREQGIDALFLLSFCLLAVVAFGVPPIVAIRQGLLKDLRKRPGTPEQPVPRAAAAMASKSQERAE